MPPKRPPAATFLAAAQMQDSAGITMLCRVISAVTGSVQGHKVTGPPRSMPRRWRLSSAGQGGTRLSLIHVW